jgi:hypothetical protein
MTRMQSENKGAADGLMSILSDTRPVVVRKAPKEAWNVDKTPLSLGGFKVKIRGPT